MSRNSTFNQTRGGMPSLGCAVLLGIVLAVILSFMTWALTIIGELVADDVGRFLQHGVPLFGDGASNISFLLLLLLGSVVVLEAAALVPASCGGAVIGFTLHRLAHENQLTRSAALLTGVLVGVTVGIGVAVLFLPLINFAGQWMPRASALWAGLVGGLVGVLQSWLMSRWMARRMT